MSRVGERKALEGFGEVIVLLEILKKVDNSAASK
jgi:hypothetical protein